MKKLIRLKKLVLYIGVLLLVLWVVMPFFVLVISSISTKEELLSIPTHWIPRMPTLNNFKAIFGLRQSAILMGDAPPFGKAIINSFTVAITVTILSLFFGSLAAYGLSQTRFSFKGMLLLIIIGLRMIPSITFVIPFYFILGRWELIDTRLGLVLVYSTFVFPFVIWSMHSFYESVPSGLSEAARIDGCTRVSAFYRVILPLSMPGLTTTAIFAFLIAYDDFLFALIMTHSYASKTIPVAISEFSARFVVDYGMMASGGIVASIVPLVFAFIFQKRIVKGLWAGAIKG